MDEHSTILWMGLAWMWSLALVNAVLAQTKNRRPGEWLLYSLFLGPISTALLIMLPTVELTPEGLRQEKRFENTITGVLTVVVVVAIIVMIGMYVNLALR